MQDPPSLQQKGIDSGSSAEADSEESLCHDYSDTNANYEDEKYHIEIDDDKEDEDGMDDSERDDEAGAELWLSAASLLSSLSAASPLTLSASSSFNCSMNHFEMSSWKDSRRTSIDGVDKSLALNLRGLIMTGGKIEPAHRLNMEEIQQQRICVTAAADSSSAAAARVVDGELILGNSRGQCEFTTSVSVSLPPPITSTTPPSSTAAETQTVAVAESMLSRWRFQGRRSSSMTTTMTTTTSTTTSW